MFMRRFVFYFTISFLFSGCITDYELKYLDNREKAYSISSLIRPEEPAELYLTRVGDVGDLSPITDPEAFKVWIAWNSNGERNSDTLAYSDGRFIGSHLLQHSLEYSLSVKTPDEKIISAKTVIPPPVAPFGVHLQFPAGFIQLENVTGPFSRFKLTLPNVSSGITYYESMVIEVRENNGINTYRIIKSLNGDTEVLSENLPSNYLPYFLFQSGSKEEELVLNFDAIQGNALLSDFLFRLTSVSEDYFLYKKSLYRHLDALEFSSEMEASSLFFPDIFKQIQTVHSNIEGGVGIFAGYNPTDYPVTCNLSDYACI